MLPQASWTEPSHTVAGAWLLVNRFAQTRSGPDRTRRLLLRSMWRQPTRRRAEDQLSRHMVGQVAQRYVFREHVSGVRGPCDGIQPHTPGLADVHAAIGRGGDRPQWSRMSVSPYLGRRSGDRQLWPGIEAGDSRQRVAQSHTGLLGDEDRVRGSVRQRGRATERDGCRTWTVAVVPGPGHPGDRPSWKERPRAPQRRPRISTGLDARPHTGEHIG